MDKKILCVIRVSTEQQEMQSQHDDMAKWLAGMGYKSEEIEWLESAGASARSLNAKYLQLLEDIKRITTTTNIKAVAIWHINRLGRVESKLMDMKEFFVQNKVQLYIKESNVQLLDDNGNLTTGGSLVFSLFAAMVAEDTKEMMSKFARGKAERRKQNIWEGAELPLGYTLTDDKHIIVDEATANIVREVFNLYATGEWSTTRLATELNERGITDPEGRKFRQSRVARILSKREYTGAKGEQVRTLPAIITPELFNKCEQLRKGAKVVRKHNYASAYLCNKLIKCSCGYNFTASNTIYRCFKEHHETVNKVPKNERLTHTGVTLSINMMDSLVWRLAADMEVGKMLENDRLKVNDYKAELYNTESKLVSAKDKLHKFDAKREQVTDMVIEGMLSKDKAKAKLAKIDAEEITTKADVDAIKADIKRLSAIISTLEHPTIDIELFEKLNENLPENIEKKRAIVRTHIDRIEVSEWHTITTAQIQAANIFTQRVQRKEKRYTLITIYDVYGFSYQYRYFPRWSFGKSRLEQLTDGVWAEVKLAA
jgi:hypothetical protein